MTHVKIDSRIFDRPDFLELHPHSKILFIAGVCHLTEHRLGETLPWSCIPALQSDVGLTARELRRAAADLLHSELWTSTDDGYYVKGRGRIWKPGPAPFKGRLPIYEWMRLRAWIFKRDDYTCRYCGIRAEKLECDHVVPVSRGGSNDPANLVTSCQRCNRTKAARLVEEWI